MNYLKKNETTWKFWKLKTTYIVSKMEDYHNSFSNGRQPNQFWKWKTSWNKWMQPNIFKIKTVVVAPLRVTQYQTSSYYLRSWLAQNLFISYDTSSWWMGVFTPIKHILCLATHIYGSPCWYGTYEHSLTSIIMVCYNVTSLSCSS